MFLPLPRPSLSPSPRRPAARVPGIPRAPPAARTWQVREHAFPMIRLCALISSKFILRGEPVPAQPRGGRARVSPSQCGLGCGCDRGRRPRAKCICVARVSSVPITFFLLLDLDSVWGGISALYSWEQHGFTSLVGKWSYSLLCVFPVWSPVAGGCCPGSFYLKSKRVAFPLSHNSRLPVEECVFSNKIGPSWFSPGVSRKLCSDLN